MQYLSAQVSQLNDEIARKSSQVMELEQNIDVNESALHHAFDSKKVNKINGRREFFHVTLDEIKCVVRANFDKTVEWTDVAEAEQYRQSLIIDPTSTIRTPCTTSLPDVINDSNSPENSNESPVIPIENQSFSNAPTEIDTPTVESIVENLKSNFSRTIPDFSCTPEEKSDSVKLHIYTTDSRKIGIAQIMKSDMSIQIKKIGQQYVGVSDIEQAAKIFT